MDEPTQPQYPELTGTGLTLWTSHYQNKSAINASGYAPIGFTLGHPRFKLGYVLVTNLRDLAPSSSLLDEEDPEQFRKFYRRQLHQLTPARVHGLLQKAGDKAAAMDGRSGTPFIPWPRTLVLLCFEDLTKPGEWCHRRLFAEWWEDMTGQEVRELVRTAS